MLHPIIALSLMLAAHAAPAREADDNAVPETARTHIATEFLEATFGRDPERMKAVLSDQAEYHVMGSSPRFQRVWDRESWAAYLALPDPFADGYALTIHAVTPGAGRVVVEAEGRGVVAQSGAIYNNRYAFVFEFAEGKIVQVREYMDTEHVIAVFPPQVENP